MTIVVLVTALTGSGSSFSQLSMGRVFILQKENAVQVTEHGISHSSICLQRVWICETNTHYFRSAARWAETGELWAIRLLGSLDTQQNSGYLLEAL